MAVENQVTEFYGFPLPYQANPLSHDVESIRAMVSAVDSELRRVDLLIAQKAGAEEINAAMQALQQAINTMGAARIKTINGKGGLDVTLSRDDINLGPANGASATTFTYDANGRVSAIAQTLDGKPVAVAIDYDGTGRPQKVTTTYNTSKRVETIAYDGNGRVSGTTATEGAA